MQKQQTKKRKKVINIKKTIEDKFLYNDSITATAGKFLLAAVLAAPLFVVASAAPNILSRARKFKKHQKYSEKQIQTAFNNLKQRKLIEIIKVGKEKYEVRLTNKGQKRIKEFSFDLLNIAKPKKWDKKWRIFIFDIPVKPKRYHQAREALRRKIKELGFYQIQKSVWVYPYECEDEILFISELFNVQKNIEIITAEKLLHQEKIEEFFNL
jgi:DNA-binding transcriptional regulator PaaX